jgi:hypothetical protein
MARMVSTIEWIRTITLMTKVRARVDCIVTALFIIGAVDEATAATADVPTIGRVVIDELHIVKCFRLYAPERLFW